MSPSLPGPSGRMTRKDEVQPTAPVKLRMSCDLCQELKIKCGQEKPACQRCAKQALPCLYSPQRRIGRPRKARSARATITTPTMTGQTRSIRAPGGDPPQDPQFLPSQSRWMPGDDAEADWIREHRADDVDMTLDMDGSPSFDFLNHWDLSSIDLDSSLFVQTCQPQGLSLPSTSNCESIHDIWPSDCHQPGHLLSRASYDFSAAGRSTDASLGPAYIPGSASTTLLDDFSSGRRRSGPEGADVVEDEDNVTSCKSECYKGLAHGMSMTELCHIREDQPPAIDSVLLAYGKTWSLRESICACTRHRSSGSAMMMLALLAERVIALHEELFRFADRVGMDQDQCQARQQSQSQSPPSSAGAARSQRAARSMAERIAACPIPEAKCGMLIGNYEVDNVAKRRAIKRILRRRIHAMFGMVKELNIGREEARPHSCFSTGLHSEIKNTLTDNLLGRIEYLQGRVELAQC